MRNTSRRHSRRRLLPTILLAAGLLTGCGPASLRAHLPSLPHIYLFQSTKLVQTPPSDLLLAQNQLPGNFTYRGSQPMGNTALESQTSDAAAATALVAQWHRQDGAVGTYALNLAPGTLAIPTLVQIDIARCASVADAQGYYKGVLAQATAATPNDIHWLPDPNLGPLDAAYDLQRSAITARVLYFVERNLVVRVTTIGANNSTALGMTTLIAQRQHDRINSTP